jgi:sugar phosphate isomerase/epimerase
LVVDPEVLCRGGTGVRRLADQFGLRILSVHPPLFPLPGWTGYSAIVSRLTRLAQEVGSPLAVLHPPRVRRGDHPHSLPGIDALETAWGTLPPAPVRLALENPVSPPDAHRPLADPTELRSYAQSHDLLLVLDTAHAASLPQSLGHTYQCFDGRLVNVHLSDVSESCLLPDIFDCHSFLRRHQFPGEGMLPLTDLVRRLVTDGYEGLVTLELSPYALRVWWPPTAERRLRRAVAWFRDAVARAGVN